MPTTPLSQLVSWNPLRGLSMPELVSRIELGERGGYADIQWTFRFVEKRNPTVRAIKAKLIGALGRLDWDIKVRSDLPEEKKAVAEQQKAKLRSAYERIGNLRQALVQLALAELRGFTHVEKIYGPKGQGDATFPVTELRFVPQWHWKRDGLFGDWCYDPQAKLGSYGMGLLPVDPARFIIREVEDPASEIFAVCHLEQQLTEADWSGFLELYGIPSIFIIGPPNVPPAREAQYQRTAEQIVSDGRGYLPNGTEVKDVEPPAGHSEVFEKRLRWLQELMVLAGTGGILSMLSGNTGIGKGPSEQHAETWTDVAATIAARVSEAMQAQFDTEILGPDVEPLAYFEFAKPSEEDVAGHAANAKTLHEAGYTVDAEELSEKTGYKLSASATAPAPSSSSPIPINAKSEAASQPGAQTSAMPPAEPGSPPAATAVATPPESAASPEAQPEDLGEPVREATKPNSSSAGEAKPSLVTAALGNQVDVDAKVFAPLQPRIDEIEKMVSDGADPGAIIAKIEALIAELPDILGSLDLAPLVDAIEAATGPAAVQGVRDAIAARKSAVKPTA